MTGIVDDPHMPVGIVRTDLNFVRPFAALRVGEQAIVLRPRLDQFPLTVEYQDEISRLIWRSGGPLAGRSPRAVEANREFLGKLDLSAIHYKDAIRRFGKHA